MYDTDEFFKGIERTYLVNPLRSTGETENAFWQSIGKYYNMDIPFYGSEYEEMLGSIIRTMIGQKEHGYHQNKKTENEKLAEKGVENAGY